MFTAVVFSLWKYTQACYHSQRSVMTDHELVGHTEDERADFNMFKLIADSKVTEEIND